MVSFLYLINKQTPFQFHLLGNLNILNSISLKASPKELYFTLTILHVNSEPFMNTIWVRLLNLTLNEWGCKSLSQLNPSLCHKMSDMTWPNNLEFHLFLFSVIWACAVFNFWKKKLIYYAVLPYSFLFHTTVSLTFL